VFVLKSGKNGTTQFGNYELLLRATEKGQQLSQNSFINLNDPSTLKIIIFLDG
jgi:hypothetical protein